MNKELEPAPTDKAEPSRTAAEEALPVPLEPPADSAPVAEAEQPGPAATQGAGDEPSPASPVSGQTAAGTGWVWVKRGERVLALFANLAVIFGIWFGVRQLTQADLMERRRIAIEAVAQTRTPEFLSAYRTLKDAYASQQVKKEDKKEDREKLADSLNQVMSVYEQIAILYVQDVADKCIIKAGVSRGARSMAPIASYFTEPDKYWENFNSFLLRMEREGCGQPAGGSP